MESTNTVEIKGTILEIVSYRVKPTHLSNLAERQAAAHRELMAMKGFISYKTMKSTKEGNTFVDIVEWDSLAEAKAAAEEVTKSQGFQQLMEAIEEMTGFDHLQEYR